MLCIQWQTVRLRCCRVWVSIAWLGVAEQRRRKRTETFCMPSTERDPSQRAARRVARALDGLGGDPFSERAHRVRFAKDYDAIVTVRTDVGERRFALEYERTPKPAKCYRAIASCISQEVHVNRLLYLVANYDILRFVSGFFTKAGYPVFFGLLTDWHSHLLEMPVLNGLAKRAFPLQASFEWRHVESRGHADRD